MATKTDPFTAISQSVTSSLVEVVQLKQTLQQRDHTIADLNSKNEGLRKDLQSEKAKTAALENSLKETQASIAALQKEHDKLNADHSKLQSELDVSEKASKQLQKEHDKLVKRLEKAEQKEE